MAEYIDREKIREETCKGCVHRTEKDGCGWPEPCEKLIGAFLNAEPSDITYAIDPESLPIVQELRAELANCKQELRQIKYCYDIAKNGEKQLRKQNDEITAAWAECAKKLKQVTAERDAAIKSCAELAEYELTVCEEFCYGDAQHDIPPCEWLVDGKCALREWVKEYA